MGVRPQQRIPPVSTMRHCLWLAGVLATLSVIPKRAHSQTAASPGDTATHVIPPSTAGRLTLATLPQGSRIRFATILDERRAYTSVVERVTADSLILRSGRRFARTELAQLEWSAGHRPAGTRVIRGAAVGAAVGGIFGLLVPPQETGNGVGQPQSRAEGLVGYGAIGGVIGLVTGLFRSGERWEPVSLKPQ
jgi:hypothetical protein